MGSLGFTIRTQVFEDGVLRPENTLDSDLDGRLTLKDLLEWVKGELVVSADEFLREEQQAGFDKAPVAVVDGRYGKKIADVYPLGKIEFVARQDFSEIVTDAYTSLLQLSKVLTGRYKASHYVFHNGKQVATDLSSVQAWLKSDPDFQEKDVIRIVDIQPYARRLELLGVTSERSKPRKREKTKRGAKTGQIFRVPNGAYQLAYRRIRYKYKSNAYIQFKFLPGNQIGLSGTFKRGKKGQIGRPYLYPSLVIGFQSAGVL